MRISPNKRLFIIEGIAGAGKNTLHQELLEKLKSKTIYDYPEEAMLFSWKHAWIPEIDKLRIIFYNMLLDYIELTLKEDKNSIFILNRFHISYALFCNNNSLENGEYREIIRKIKRLKAHIYVPVLNTVDIEHRSSHKERTEKIWKKHLQKRMKQKGFRSITEMYSDEQERILRLLEKQGIDYSTTRIKI